MRIAIWGRGNTAAQNMSIIKKISNRFELTAFVDGYLNEPEKDSVWEGYRVVPPQMIPYLNIDYLCILSVKEWDIRKRIQQENLLELSKIISLHEIVMMDLFGNDLSKCYEKLFRSIPPCQKGSLEEWAAYGYLKRRYSYVLLDNKYWDMHTDKKCQLGAQTIPIWILWLQGFQNAPQIVKVCVHSIRNKLGEKEKIYLLDQDNLFDYIDLPDYIMEKWKNGIISNTHFSDLVRVCLLNTYGGIWIDSTVYFTGGELPYYLKNGKLFMLSRWIDWEKRREVRIASNWLISSPPRNNMLIILEALLKEYWKNENELVHYFLFHVFWAIIVECCPDGWREVETVLRDPSELLAQELDNKFEWSRFEDLKRMTDFHKLSYKTLPYEKAGRNSYFAEICRIEEIRGEENA